MVLTVEGFAGLFHELTDRLRPDGVAELLQAAGQQAVAPGEAVLREGEKNDRLLFVHEGGFTVRVLLDGKAVEVGRADPGTVLGEVSFVLKNPASATVTALVPSTVLVLSRDRYDELARRGSPLP